MGISVLGLSSEEVYDLNIQTFNRAVNLKNEERLNEVKLNRKFFVDLMNHQRTKNPLKYETYLPLEKKEPISQDRINEMKNAWNLD